MNDFVIDVGRLEEWQMLNDRDELEKMFAKAKSTIVNGATVLFVRKSPGGKAEKFDELDNLEDLENYQSRIMKYVK